MIDSTAPRDLSSAQAWQALSSELRPFLARRLSAQAEADVDDVLQDVFVRMQRGLPSLRDDEHFGPWVYQVARSALIDHLRSRARHPLLKGEAPQASDVAGEPDDDRAVEREVASYAGFFLTLLPSPYREALTLTELQGLTQKEAAEQLGISLSGMKSRVQRGRQKLRTALEDCCHIALDSRQHVMACQPRPDGKVPQGCCS